MNTKELCAKLDEIAESVKGLAAEHEAKVDAVHKTLLALHALAPMSYTSHAVGPRCDPPTREDASYRLLCVEGVHYGVYMGLSPRWLVDGRETALAAVESWLSERGLAKPPLRTE